MIIEKNNEVNEIEKINESNEPIKEEEKKIEEKTLENETITKEETKEEKIEKLIAKKVLKDTPINTKFSCATIESTPLSSVNNPKISVDSPIKVESSGIFSKPYTTYQIQLEQINSKVRRRFSDFDWLQNILSYLFVGNIIPRLSKQNVGDKFNDDLINKRILDMKMFLEYIVADPLLKSSQIVYDFFTVEKDYEFNNKKNAYDKIKKPINLLQVKSLDGKDSSIINTENDNIAIKIKYNSELMITLFNNISEKIEIIYENLKNVSINMNEVSELLHKISTNEFGLEKKVCNSYQSFSEHMKIYSDLIKNQSDLFSKFRDKMKFFRREYTSIKDFQSIVELNKLNYLKAEEKLLLKKNNLFNKGDITKWEMKIDSNLNITELKTNKELAFTKMIPKETESVYQSKLVYGYYNNRLINQYKMIKKLICDSNLLIFKDYFEKQNNFIEDFNLNVGKNISTINEDLKNNENNSQNEEKNIELI